MSLFASQVYDDAQAVAVEVIHHPREGTQRAFEALRLGALTLIVSRAQLVELTNRLCDYLALSEPEIATVGELGVAAVAGWHPDAHSCWHQDGPDPVVHHDTDEERADYLATWREHQELHS